MIDRHLTISHTKFLDTEIIKGANKHECEMDER